MDELLKKCDKDNWLLKSYISEAWGTLGKYKKVRIDRKDSNKYDFRKISSITSSIQYEYYSYEENECTHTLIKSDDPFKYGGLARIKVFLPEFARNYIFNMVSEYNLSQYVKRVHTDGICFSKKINFGTVEDMPYKPIPEAKSTGVITFRTVNYYRHCCYDCECEYKFNKKKPHKC